MFKVGSAKYPPPPNSKIADLDLVFKVGSAKVCPRPPPPNSKIADLDLVFKVGLAKYPPPPRKFKNSRFGLSVQSWIAKVPPSFPPPKKNSKIADLDLVFKVGLTELGKYGLDGPAAETVPPSGYHLVKLATIKKLEVYTIVFFFLGNGSLLESSGSAIRAVFTYSFISMQNLCQSKADFRHVCTFDKMCRNAMCSDLC